MWLIFLSELISILIGCVFRGKKWILNFCILRRNEDKREVSNVFAPHGPNENFRLISIKNMNENYDVRVWLLFFFVISYRGMSDLNELRFLLIFSKKRCSNVLDINVIIQSLYSSSHRASGYFRSRSVYVFLLF